MKKKKILLLSDDLRMHSGIGTMSREFVMNTLDHYDWVQLGAAIKHPEEGKVIDMKESIKEGQYLKIYASSGYGNPQIIRELIDIEKPDAIMHYTDPRFWTWLYQMEHEIRETMPLMFYTIWDDLPYPRWNEPFYESCDLLMCISKQTYNIVHNVCRKYPKEDWQITYIPHGVSQDSYFPVDERDSDYIKFKKKLVGDSKFVVFYNNRNIRRKMPGDVILAYKTFCDMLPKEKADECCLLMHTHRVDQNGTDLPAVVKEICPEYKVAFSDHKLDEKHLNYLYNTADVQMNIASNEGFGLGTCEALMSGTPIIVNVTGGLQDQCGFKLKGKHIGPDDYREIHSLHDDRKWADNPDLTWGEWCKPVWPSNRALVGSPPTPYIFDDRCRFDDAADAIKDWYDMGGEERKRCGNLGREFVLKEEIGMSNKNMAKRFIKDMDTCLENFKPRKKFNLYTI